MQLSFTDVQSVPTIQYMGSKRELLGEIVSEIHAKARRGTYVADLFAGTCSIGYGLKPTYPVLANDLQAYSATICQAVLNTPRLPAIETLLAALWPAYNLNLESLRAILHPLVEKETSFWLAPATDQIVAQYQAFCDETPFSGCNFAPSELFACMSPLLTADAQHLRRSNPATFPWALNTMYFMNGYFGVYQSLEIDSLRYAIEHFPNSSYRSFLLTALMSAMSVAVSSTTHFAQFLKADTVNRFKHLRARRSQSVRSLFISALSTLAATYSPTTSGGAPNVVCQRDALELLTQKDLPQISCVYADPPYFKEHYSRYYHVLETLVLYDYPALTFNPRVGGPTVGRYRKDRQVSPFGKRASALQAFDTLFALAAQNGSSTIVSYANTSLIDITSIVQAAREHYGRVSTRELSHRHSSQGRKTSQPSAVTEYLIICS